MWFRYFIMVFLTFCSATFAQPASVAQTDPTQTIMVTSNNPIFTIKLAANPGTGYSWLLHPYNTDFIALKNYSYIAPNTATPGAPGTATWQFQLKPQAFIAPSTYTLTFEYKRPWEAQSGDKKTFTIVTAPRSQ